MTCYKNQPCFKDLLDSVSTLCCSCCDGCLSLLRSMAPSVLSYAEVEVLRDLVLPSEEEDPPPLPTKGVRVEAGEEDAS